VHLHESLSLHNYAAAAVALPAAATLRRTTVGRCSNVVSCSYGVQGYPYHRVREDLAELAM
jgi:hypothetical protein